MCRRSEGESPGFGVAHAAAAQNPFAENTAEDSHAEDHHRGHRDVAAQRSRHRHGYGHRDGFGGYRVENHPLGAECLGRINDAQHPCDASDERSHSYGNQAAAQPFDLFVEQVAERHDRHPQREVENPGRFLIAGVGDARCLQKDNHGNEREQYGVQQSQPGPAVDDAAQAEKPRRQHEQKEVRGDEAIHSFRDFCG